MRCKAFDGLYIGWIWNRRAQIPMSHVVTALDGSVATVACGVPTYAMYESETFSEPKGATCKTCAEYVRMQLLSRVTELASARTPLTPSDAQALLQDLAERSRAVVS